MLVFHPTLSASPVHKAFPHIEWNAPIAVSRPEQSLLQSAEENPLEYTLAEFGDAFAYARLLLKVLDQVTGPSNPGRVSELGLEGPLSAFSPPPSSQNVSPAFSSSSSSQPLPVLASYYGGSSNTDSQYSSASPQHSQLDLEEEEALRYLHEDKTGVVTHYLISQLYHVMGLLAERPAHSSIRISTIFYRQNKLLEDWRPLLRLLYRPGDPFSQRGAALCLAYILQSGCSQMTTKGVKIPMVEETLQSLVSWLTSRLQSSHGTSLGVVTPTLLVLATCPQARIVLDHAGGIGYLSRHLRPRSQPSRKESSRRSNNPKPHHTYAQSTTTSTTASLSNHSSSSSTLYRRSNSKGELHKAYTNGGKSNGYAVGPPSPTPKRKPVTGVGGGGTNGGTSGRYASLYSHVSVQQLYELAFCLWTMTHECKTNESIRQHFARDGAVSALGELLAAAPREKVVRLAVASLRNLAEAAPEVFVPEMVSCGCLKPVDALLEQRRSRASRDASSSSSSSSPASAVDPEMMEDLEVLSRILHENYKELTKWEVYLAELESGHLKWGILHTEQFFQANARKMEGRSGDFRHVRRLLQLIRSHCTMAGSPSSGTLFSAQATSYTGATSSMLLDDDEREEVVAVACFDLGEFVRHYPSGKAIAKRLGAKEIIMPLMDHDDPGVQRQALQCISKLLVNNWQAALSSSGKGAP